MERFYMTTLGQVIKDIRIKNNLTQIEFSNKIFVSHQTVSSWELNKSKPDIDLLLFISERFDYSLNIFVEQKSKKDTLSLEEKNKIAFSFLSLLSQKNDSHKNLKLISQHSEIDIEKISITFPTVDDIFNYISKNIDNEVKQALNKSELLSPFDSISDYVIPVLYEHSHELHILYTSSYADGKWISFLEHTYKKWLTTLFKDSHFEPNIVNKTFDIELLVKWILSIISTWLSQPIPENPEVFKKYFLNIVHSSPIDLFPE